MYQKIITTILLLTLTIFHLPAEESHFQQPPVVNILMIHSANSSNEASLGVANGVQNALLEREVAFSMEVFELNMLYDANPEKWNRFFETYLPDIKAGQYELIIAESDEACATLLRYLAVIPPEVSVILANITDIDLAAVRKQHANTTAILRPRTAIANVKLGLKIFPTVKEVMILTARQDWHPENDETAIRSLLPPGVDLRIIFFDDDQPETLKNIADELAKADKNSFLVSMEWDRFFATRSARVGVWNYLKKQYDGPIFVRRMVNMPFAFGGVISSLLTAGAITGEVAEQIACGNQAGNLDSVTCSEITVFNDKELQRFKGVAAALPAGSEIINRPEAWYHQYHLQWMTGTIGLGTICVMLMIFIIFLLLRQRRMRLEPAILRTLPLRIFVFDSDGNILYTNSLDNDAKSRKTNGVYRHASDLPWMKTRHLLDAIAQVCKYDQPTTLDYNFCGEHRSIVFTKIDDRIFGKAAVISASVNSNRLQQALDEAQSAAKNYAQTLQAIGSAVVVTDHRQYVTLFNPLAEEVTGHTAAEVTGKPLQECFTLRNNQSGEVDFPLIQEVLLTGKIVKTTSNTELITNSGRRCRIIGCAAPITNDEGEITGTVMTFNDATAESRRLDDLSESVALLSNIVQYSNLSFFKVDLGSKESSPLLAGKLRYCPTRGGKAIPINEWLLPEDAQNLEKLTEKLASGSIKSASIIIKTAYSGIIQHFQLHMTAVHDRKPDSIVGICRDVTLEVAEQKRRDEELMLLESIVNLIPYPIFVKNAEDRFRYSHCNLSFAQLINRAQSEIIGKTDEQLLHGDDAELIRKNDRETLRKNERCEFIQEYHDQAGNLRRCQCVKQIISGVGGKKSLLGISIDVTASETVRIATEAVTRLFEAICDHLPFDLCVRDADNDFSCVIWNQSIAETRNIPKTERLHLPLSDSGNSAADFVTEERRCYQELLLSGEPYEEQKIFEHPAKGKLFRKIHRIPIHQDGRRLILEVATDNAAECKLQQTLSLYAQHDATVNRVLRTMLLEDDFSATTEKMLETYAKSISADRGFVFHLTGNRIVKETEWVAGVEPSLAEYAVEELSDWLTVLGSGRMVMIADTLNPPLELMNSAECLLAENVKSSIAFPIFIKGNLYGFIGFDFIQKSCAFSDNEEKNISDIGELYLLIYDRETQHRKILEQQELQAKLFDEIDSPLSLFDADFKLLLANAAYFKLWNLTPEEIVGKNCRSYCTRAGSELCSQDNCPIWQSMNCRQKKSLVGSFCNRILRGSSTPIFDGHGTLLYTFQSFIDITGESNEQNQLKQQTLELQQYIEQDNILAQCLKTLLHNNTPGAALQHLIAEIGSFMHADRCVLFLYTANDDEVKAKATWDAPEAAEEYRIGQLYSRRNFPAGNAELLAGRIVHICKAALNLQVDWQKEQQLYFDSTSTTEMMQIPVLVNGVIKGFLMLVQSTSTLFPSGFHRLLQNAVHLIEAMLERELLLAEIRIQEEKTTVNKSNFERTLAEIEGISQRKSHFLADFCHSLIARLNYLCSRFEDRQNTAAELLANLSRLEYIASLDAGDIPFQPEATASESFFNTIAASFQTDADQKKITLSLQIQPEIPDLWLDTVQTRRVLNSLLNHALSDTEQGWIELSIRFHHCGQDSGTLLMAVRDTGFGIDAERQKRIFDPDGGDLERVLCDRAIRLMGGCIELQSNPGKGSCVTVTLPVKRVTTATVQNNRLPVGDNRQESILIVDDIALNLKLLAAMLHKLGFKVHSADSGESALELLRNATPSAIFSDLWMPEMNGAELAKNIRANKKYATIPIHAVTADAESDKSFDLSAFDSVIIKPLTINKLKTTLEKDFLLRPEE